MKYLADGSMPNVFHTVKAFSLFIEGKDSLRHQFDNNCFLPLLLLFSFLLCNLFEVNDWILIEMSELINIADTFNSTLFNFTLFTIAFYEESFFNYIPDLYKKLYPEFSRPRGVKRGKVGI